MNHVRDCDCPECQRLDQKDERKAKRAINKGLPPPPRVRQLALPMDAGAPGRSYRK